MPVYQYQGKHYELPEGLTNEQALNKIKSHLGEAPKETEQPKGEQPKQQEAPPERASMVQQMFGFGSPLYSSLRGMVVQPLLGANQLLAQLPIFPEATRTGANQLVRQEAEAYQQGRAASGREGFDVPQLIGAVASPLNRFLPSGGTSAAARAGTGAAAGAVYAGVTPTSGNDDTFVEEKLFQMGLGAVVGGSVPLTVDTSKRIVRIIKDLPISQAAKDRALRKYVVELSGGKPEVAAQALREVGEIVPGSKPTAAEALSTTPSAAKLVREQQRLAGEMPEQFLTREAQQQAARQAQLTGTFGTADDLAAAVQQRTAVTSPMRETALGYADVYGRTAPKLQEAIDTATKDLKSFQPRSLGGEFSSARTQAINNVLTKNRAFKQAQLDSLKDNGFYPLSVAPLVKKIESSQATVGERSNELLQAAQTSLKNKLMRFADENGIIPSHDLYNIRKEIGEDLQAFLTARGNPSFSGQATAVEKALKAQLDDVITQASGSNLWKDYLKEFSKHSEKINQMQVGQAIKSKLEGNFTQETAGAFGNAIKESASLIKRSTGQDRFKKLDEILTPDQMSSVNKVYADLLRSERAASMASKTRVTGKVPFEAEQELPNVLSRAATVAKSILDTLRRGSQKELDQKMADMMLNPQKLADFLETMPPKEAKGVAQALIARMSPQTAEAFTAHMNKLMPTQAEVVRGTTATLMAP
jgi:hypothetical protein